MKKKFIVVFAILFSVTSFAQELDLGTCGIVNVYDAAGNRVRRVYFCNNGTDPYPQRNQPANTESSTERAETATETNAGENEAITSKNENAVFQEVDALYPNPTTGRFFITFSKNLTGASVSIIDVSGKVLSKKSASGYKAEFDLSPYAAGVYYVRIEDAGKVITKKVVKQ